ncbi:LuxR family transcriptional regulator, partial [Mycobacterium tuberculosis]|nr:LuxR family transcriptional regulator [Mycobacterium tuberculosis]
PGLIARAHLVDSLDAFLGSPDNHSAALVGDPGTGRTALLAAAEAMARTAGYRVVRLNVRDGSAGVLAALAAELGESTESATYE